MKLFSFFLTVLLHLIALKAPGQEEGGMARKGVLRSQGGFCYGMMTNGRANVYMDGTLAYYFDDRFSIRGDGFMLVPAASEARLKENSSLFTGLVYHFREEVNLDPYVAFQPGITLSRRDVPITSIESGKDPDRTLNPLISGVAGVQYYGPAVFHLLLECRYVHGQHLSERSPLSLNEFRFVFGLGLNLNVLDPFWKE